MRYVFSFLLGMLAGCFLALSVQAQSLTVAQADSLRFSLRANKADTNRVGALLRLSAYYQGRTLNYAHNLDTALVLANQAAALSQQLRYEKGQQEALFQEGKTYLKQEKLAKVKRILTSVNGLTRIRLLLELGKNKLRPTYSQEAHLDSALMYFSQAEGLSTRMGSRLWQEESQMLTGVAYLLKGDCKRSQAWFMRVIGARQRAGDKVGELRVWLRWAATQHSEWTFCDQSDSLSRAFALARQLGDRPREALLLLMVGYKHFDNRNVKQAEGEALRALSIQKVIGYVVLNRAYHVLLEENLYLSWVQLANLSSAYYLLADINATANNTNKDLFYNLEAVKDAQRSNLPEELDLPYFFIGNIYFELGQYAQSTVYYQQSLALSHQKGMVVVHVAMIRRMAESLLKAGKARKSLQILNDFKSQHLPLSYLSKGSIALGFGQCYTVLKQYKLAETYYLEYVALGIKAGESLEPYSWRYISEFYVATNQYAKAAPFLKRLAAFGSRNRPVERLILHLLQFKVDSAQANFFPALRHYQRHIALKDSILNETTSKQMAELDIKYQTKQKELALQFRQKDIALLRAEAQSQQTQRNALIGGTLLLVSLLGLSVNRYRLKQRSNRLLELQKLELQAQQKQIHDKNEDLSQVLGEKNALLAQKNELHLRQERLLEEKERLLREIHHRVKNNLQIVMSLLNSQAASLHDPSALSAIQESQHRMQAMALIHQKLYQSEGVARIPMAAYIQEVVAYLHESYALAQHIQFDVQVEPVELDVTQAVPLGLIINEAITNALKYAFPDGRAGCIQVGLWERSSRKYELVIADDGVGLPADFDPAQSCSLGLTLMYGFSEQLGGQLHISGQSGLAIQLQFHDEVLSRSTPESR